MSLLPAFLISSTYPLEKHFFLLPRFSLISIGFYPETIQTWPIRIWALFNLADLSYCVLTSVYLGMSETFVNLPAGLEMICPDITGTLSMLKLLIIWFYRKELNTIIEQIRYLLESQNSVEKTKIQRLYFTTVTRMIFVLFAFGSLTAIFFFIIDDISSLLRYIQGEPTSYKTPYFTIFPEFSMHLPWFPLAFFLSHWFGFVTVCCFVSGDGMFVSFCFYITMLIKLLAIDLRDAFGELTSLSVDVSGELTEMKENEVFQNLIQVTKRYNEIADIVGRISNVMTIMMLAQFVTSSVIIGISAVNLLLFPSYGVILYGCYSCAVLIENFLYCISGTAVMESSQELANVAYSTPWYAGSKRIQKMILILMIRTQRSLLIKAPFFAPSLEVFTAILRTTGSLIALARSLIQ